MHKPNRKKLPLWLQIPIFLIGLVWLSRLFMALYLPDVALLAFHNPSETAFMERYKKEHPKADIHYQWMKIQHISAHLKQAILVAEDDNFFNHFGFDWESIKKAAAYNWEKGRFARGASTITQQLARNLYLSPHKTIWRKVKEFFIALKLESTLSKERILELYLNSVEWAPGVYGAEAAAHHYFNLSASRLSPEQSAFLASILPNPIKLGRHGFHMSSRAWHILRLM